MQLANVIEGKKKDARGRKITGYFARLGDVKGEGNTLAEAREQLNRGIELMCQHRRPQNSRIGAYTLITCPSYDANGTTCLLVFPDGHVAESLTNETNQDICLEEAREHVAQLYWADGNEVLAWEIIAQVRAYKIDSFKSWVRFQENYRTFRSQGMNDVEAHRLACEIRA